MIIKSKVRRDPEKLGKADVSNVTKMGAPRAPRAPPPGRVYAALVWEDRDGRLEEDSINAAEWESVQGLTTLTRGRSGTPAAALALAQPHHGATLRPGGGDRSPVHKPKTVILGAETRS